MCYCLPVKKTVNKALVLALTQDTNKVLAISRIMVAWQPVGIACGVFDMCKRYVGAWPRFTEASSANFEAPFFSSCPCCVRLGFIDMSRSRKALPACLMCGSASQTKVMGRLGASFGLCLWPSAKVQAHSWALPDR
jgi:hypothetical protein